MTSGRISRFGQNVILLFVPEDSYPGRFGNKVYQYLMYEA